MSTDAVFNQMTFLKTLIDSGNGDYSMISGAYKGICKSALSEDDKLVGAIGLGALWMLYPNKHANAKKLFANILTKTTDPLPRARSSYYLTLLSRNQPALRQQYAAAMVAHFREVGAAPDADDFLAEALFCEGHIANQFGKDKDAVGLWSRAAVLGDKEYGVRASAFAGYMLAVGGKDVEPSPVEASRLLGSVLEEHGAHKEWKDMAHIGLGVMDMHKGQFESAKRHFAAVESDEALKEEAQGYLKNIQEQQVVPNPRPCPPPGPLKVKSLRSAVAAVRVVQGPMLPKLESLPVPARRSSMPDPSAAEETLLPALLFQKGRRVSEVETNMLPLLPAAWRKKE